MNSLKEAIKRLCVALDVDTLDDAERFADMLKECVGVFKIGKQLFTKEGPKVVNIIKDKGADVFLDLKYHDIPNTTANASREAVKLGVSMFNVHASGGSEMMRAAVEAAKEEAYKRNMPTPIILAVTVLTSINNEILSKELLINHDVNELVAHYAKLAKQSNLSGVVASPKEITSIRQACGEDFIILTPGIRPAWNLTADDQKRITTPKDAIALGADYIVIGRPILNAPSPKEACEKILEEIAQA
ncbi:orotidine 5'-phosphate decarboxylase [Candidatus Magnetoovum chiemensis]|nr:orotidine 5'-phosphate decarboxylase [Candidatus Magnetoovum chiemensis]